MRIFLALRKYDIPKNILKMGSRWSFASRQDWMPLRGAGNALFEKKSWFLHETCVIRLSYWTQELYKWRFYDTLSDIHDVYWSRILVFMKESIFTVWLWLNVGWNLCCSGLEVSNKVVSFTWLLDACENHLGACDIFLGVLEVLE